MADRDETKEEPPAGSSRCGSVETCRKARGILLSPVRERRCKGSPIRAMQMANVVLKNIKKVYPAVAEKKKKKGEPEKEKKNNLLVTEEGVLAVHDFNLEIKDNEFIVLVGPSGCGKSTTLRMIAGLEEISGGELYIDGKLVNDIPPKDRDIAMVFQNYALYPHMTVYENMAFGLKLRHVDPQEIDRKVKEDRKSTRLNSSHP